MALLRSYLIRSCYDWIVAHQLTPYLLVDATLDDVDVPEEYIDKGKIILNLAPAAVNDLEIEESCIHFSAGFGGVLRRIYVPINAALALYARENNMGVYSRDDGPGMWVNEGDGRDIAPVPEPDTKKADSAKKVDRSFLRVVK
ncbi:stringent starvation protein B [Piscirickettsia salmonis]|uniref:Stringent starvation B family protein n=1 Tax=Piscirickettsia salmonis TaxID=1238 RepID=A0A095BPP9_PISSA|nr:ClpXP protease specificity-enhancing factor SspB [Piscirickettsia salmonis]RNC78949.1 stringent starvation protein B [Piscirickettsiaceae bacterium NZ-RLO2]AKP72978.1 stringent starvation protein B [Piscirickettsia salmonis LF-89 = ATCC VR-1361]ALA26107.1 stringent starvation B family protein [Piscirickettsia salmonis]ALB21607.1 stringent starvation B family protein [Piscirickettsia salmonis]ALY01813.1 stringent starvation protein B [Piscirickettsia salmonis]